MRDDDFTDMGFMVELTDEEVRLIQYVIHEAFLDMERAIERSDADYHMLKNLDDNFFRMVLEMQFDPEA